MSRVNSSPVSVSAPVVYRVTVGIMPRGGRFASDAIVIETREFGAWDEAVAYAQAAKPEGKYARSFGDAVKFDRSLDLSEWSWSREGKGVYDYFSATVETVVVPVADSAMSQVNDTRYASRLVGEETDCYRWQVYDATTGEEINRYNLQAHAAIVCDQLNTNTYRSMTGDELHALSRAPQKYQDLAQRILDCVPDQMAVTAAPAANDTPVSRADVHRAYATGKTVAEQAALDAAQANERSTWAAMDGADDWDAAGNAHSAAVEALNVAKRSYNAAYKRALQASLTGKAEKAAATPSPEYIVSCSSCSVTLDGRYVYEDGICDDCRAGRYDPADHCPTCGAHLDADADSPQGSCASCTRTDEATKACASCDGLMLPNDPESECGTCRHERDRIANTRTWGYTVSHGGEIVDDGTFSAELTDNKLMFELTKRLGEPNGANVHARRFADGSGMVVWAKSCGTIYQATATIQNPDPATALEMSAFKAGEEAYAAARKANKPAFAAAKAAYDAVKEASGRIEQRPDRQYDAFPPGMWCSIGMFDSHDAAALALATYQVGA